MISRLRRKRPTTARRITPATLAAKVAALVVLAAAPVLAQPPGNQPVYQQPVYQQPGAQPPGSSPGSQPGSLPYPPGYRPRTPPPVRSNTTPNTLPGGGSGGTVMYFQKPADALTATGGSGSSADGAAQLNGPGVPALPVPAPDALVPPLPPPPPASRYLPGDKPVTPPLPQPVLNARPVPPAAPAVYVQPEPEGQPKKGQGDLPPSTSEKKVDKIPSVDPKYVQLPPRESIFIAYNNAQLEQEIMKRIRDELKRDQKYTPEQEKFLVFPPLPVVSPPGVPYEPKTLTYEPRKLFIEPGYVVHRRLYFEEKNAERAGWDLGPMQILVSSMYFWYDSLTIAHTAASGCVSGFWDTSAGKCLPGSPSPYYLYPPNLTVTGSLAEGAVLTGFFYLFP